MRKRRNHDAGFKARGALEALKGERTVSELAAEYGVHPTMIHQWSEPWSAIGPRTMASALPDGAADIFERGISGSLADLQDHDCLRASGVTHWSFAEGQRHVVAGRFTASSIEALHDACLVGLGIAALARWNVEADLQAGRLVAVDLRDAQPEPLDIWAVYANRRGVLIPPLLHRLFRRIYAAIFSFWAGVIPPLPMLGRSWL